MTNNKFSGFLCQHYVFVCNITFSFHRHTFLGSPSIGKSTDLISNHQILRLENDYLKSPMITPEDHR